MLFSPACPSDPAIVDGLIGLWFRMILVEHNLQALRKLLDVID